VHDPRCYSSKRSVSDIKQRVILADRAGFFDVTLYERTNRNERENEGLALSNRACACLLACVAGARRMSAWCRCCRSRVPVRECLACTSP